MEIAKTIDKNYDNFEKTYSENDEASQPNFE